MKAQLVKVLKKIFDKNRMVINYTRMWPFVKPYRFRALLGVLLTIPVGSLDAAIAWFLKPIMDEAMIAKQAQFSKMLPFIIVGFTVIQGVLNYAANYLNTWVGSKIGIGLKRELYDKLLDMDASYFDRTSSGKVVYGFFNDADAACSGLINNLKGFLSKFFSSLALLFVLIYNSWQLAIIAVVVMGAAFIPIKFVRSKMKEIMNKTVGANSEIVTIYNETYSGNKTIQSYTLETRQRDKFANMTNTAFSLSMNMIKGTNWLSPLMHVITSVGVALVIGFGSYLIVNAKITAGNFVSFIAALLMLYTPIKTVGNNVVALEQSFLAIERVFNLFALKPAVVNRPSAKKISSIKQNIIFDKVHFSYKQGREVLSDINLEIKVGQTVALVGNSGGGKTTIASLIPRLYDINKGAILIDGTDIRDITLESLRKNIAMVFQDNFLFKGTIRENILLGDPAACDKAIMLALKNAHLDDFVKGLPSGVDTQIGERGTLLSGGQKQRVAIARAFVKNAPVVILDEATSALDNKSEKIVQDALDNLMKNRTVIVIAHRLSTIQNADKIVVINDGHITESGTHKELLVIENGAYSALYNAQFKQLKTNNA